jgi:hypothetical protein
MDESAQRKVTADAAREWGQSKASYKPAPPDSHHDHPLQHYVPSAEIAPKKRLERPQLLLLLQSQGLDPIKHALAAHRVHSGPFPPSLHTVTD